MSALPTAASPIPPSRRRPGHVDGVDPGGAALQKAIGEAAVGSADIETNECQGVDYEGFQGAFQL